jgi:hypothetical protein
MKESHLTHIMLPLWKGQTEQNFAVFKLQQVNCLPSLLTHNHFNVLSIESNETVETIDKVMQDPELSLPPTLMSWLYPKS